MSHTPGPWSVHSLLVGPLCIRDKAGDDIALVGHDDFPICAANAELIAAAPDLLAACEAFEASNNDDEEYAALALMGAAIAKARRR